MLNGEEMQIRDVYDTTKLEKNELAFENYGSTRKSRITMTDSQGFLFPAICYNGSHLWIGQDKADDPDYHYGNTYIAAGRKADGTFNTTAYISVLESSAQANNYGIWHAGNFTPSDKLDKSGWGNTEARVFISNANGNLAVSNLPYSYISGLTSSAQTQLNGKQDTLTITTPSITKNTITGVSSSTITVKQYGKVVSVDITITLTATISSQTTLATGLPQPVDGVRTQEFLPSPSSYSRPLRFILDTSGNLDIRHGAAGTIYHHMVYLAT